jgi:hypothetical protein
MRAAEGRPERRAQPMEKKSQRDAEGHFRFTPDAITKSDGNFTYA